MKKTILVAGLSAALIIPSISFADNMTGFHVGADVQFKSTGIKLELGGASADEGGMQEIIAGINLGYTFGVSSTAAVMLGMTADLGKTNSFEWTDGTDTIKGYENEHYSVYVAPGYLINPSTMVYGKLSYHSAKATLDFVGIGTDSTKHRGFGYGVGLRAALDNNFFVYTEAERVDYNSKTIPNSAAKLEPSSTIARIGLGYRF